MASYAEQVGERLRNVRVQKGLSLHDVELESGGEFKASVLGAYERGERSISVNRLQRLAMFYGVRVDGMLPRIGRLGHDPAQRGPVHRPPGAGPAPGAGGPRPRAVRDDPADAAWRLWGQDAHHPARGRPRAGGGPRPLAGGAARTALRARPSPCGRVGFQGPADSRPGGTVDHSPKVAFKTLGCRLNQAESEKALEGLGARGFDLAHAGEEPDVVVINTCTVTRESTASSRRLIRRTAEAHPGATVVVTGCYAVSNPEEVQAIPGVDLVVHNDDKDRIAELVTAVPTVRRLPLTVRRAPTERLRTRVAIKAQTGCDEWCTFCIIPRTRGPLRSYPEEEIVADVRRQVERGVLEVVLTGVHLGKYGEDEGERDGLARLVERLTAIDGLLRLRISSVLPVQVTPALVERVRDDPKVCRHLHVPLQAGDDRVLERMHRPYRIAQFLERVEHASAEIPGLGLSTDIIVGFPGETAEQFGATLRVTRRVGFSKLHVFRYSQRPGTPAADMPDQLPEPDKKARARELIALGAELRRRFHEAHVGERLDVLVESAGDGIAEGTSDNYIKVRFPGGPELLDRLVAVRGVRADNEGMEGQVEEVPAA